MLTLADWAKLITEEKGRLQTLGIVEAMSDLRGWPLLRLLPFRPVDGQAYVANWGTAAIEAATRAMSVDFVESAPGVDQFTFLMRAAGGNLGLDINQIAGPNGNILRAGLLTEKARNIGARLNRLWFKGDKDDGGGAEWHGANEFCDDQERVIEAGEDGAVISSELMDAALAAVPGANLILANRTLSQQINGLEVGVTKTVILNQGGLAPGMFVQTYKGVPVLPVDTAPDDETGMMGQILDFDETQGGSDECSRVTVARIGMDGIYGIHNRMMELAPPRRAGAFEYNDMNWFMAGLATDYPDSIVQVIGVLATEPG